ncbi:MAG: GH32 C-terminal domain-containing protein, partial [Lachnospiraceae bacterium]|nr:GH32 C-terminal domain-containing protein [Lachnospiraceae bacterium]
AGTRVIDPEHPFRIEDAAGFAGDPADPDAVRHSRVSGDLPFLTGFDAEGEDGDKDARMSQSSPSGSTMVHHIMHSPSADFVVGNGASDFGWGNMILFKSKDLKKWTYCGKLIYEQKGFDRDFFRLNGVYECPDFFESNGQEIILASPQNLPKKGHKFENQHSTIYIAGKLNYETGRYQMAKIRELDAGFDFYAPQSMRLPDGRIVMIAWKEMWDRTYPMVEDGWAGTYTLPRELEWKNGHLYQYPVRELCSYRQNPVSAKNVPLSSDKEVRIPGMEGNVIELDALIDPGTASKVGVKIFVGSGHETVLTYDPAQNTLVFDRTRGGLRIEGREDNVNIRTLDVKPEGTLRLQIFLDICSAEVFVNGGRYVLTGNVYADLTDTGIAFFAEGGEGRLLSAVKYDLVVE